jgi:hypothetical protein
MSIYNSAGGTNVTTMIDTEITYPAQALSVDRQANDSAGSRRTFEVTDS